MRHYIVFSFGCPNSCIMLLASRVKTRFCVYRKSALRLQSILTTKHRTHVTTFVFIPQKIKLHFHVTKFRNTFDFHLPINDIPFCFLRFSHRQIRSDPSFILSFTSTGQCCTRLYFSQANGFSAPKGQITLKY